jgi:hypothetical protein
VQKLFPPELYFCKSEVPFGLKRIDMLFRQKSNGQEIIAVELKLTKWKRAIWQAASNRLVARFSYVAMPAVRARAVDAKLVKSLGLGLIVADSAEEARIVVPAKPSPYVNKRIANQMSNLLAAG